MQSTTPRAIPCSDRHPRRTSVLVLLCLAAFIAGCSDKPADNTSASEPEPQWDQDNPQFNPNLLEESIAHLEFKLAQQVFVDSPEKISIDQFAGRIAIVKQMQLNWRLPATREGDEIVIHDQEFPMANGGRFVIAFEGAEPHAAATGDLADVATGDRVRLTTHVKDYTMVADDGDSATITFMLEMRTELGPNDAGQDGISRS